MTQSLPQIASAELVGLELVAAGSPADEMSWLTERISEQRDRAAEFSRHYRQRIAALEASLVERLAELEDQTRRRVEADFQFAADEVARQRRRQKKRQARLECEAERLELRRTRTKLQRRRLAAFFRMKHRRLRNLSRTEADASDYRKLVAERDALANRLSEAVGQLEASQADTSADETELLRQRLERALNDVRDLKRRNAELEQQGASAGRGVPAGKSGTPGGLDWESQKQRMLAALEADDGGGETRVQDRLTIEGTIRITDEVVQAKDREIGELRKQLEQQPAPAAVLLPSVEAMAEILDRDEGIRVERQRLKELGAQWQEKLKQAEIDLSMERAKFARQQAELEELRRFQASRQQDSGGESVEADQSKVPARGRWLARLGLKDGE